MVSSGSPFQIDVKGNKTSSTQPEKTETLKKKKQNAADILASKVSSDMKSPVIDEFIKEEKNFLVRKRSQWSRCISFS